MSVKIMTVNVGILLQVGNLLHSAGAAAWLIYNVEIKNFCLASFVQPITAAG